MVGQYHSKLNTGWTNIIHLLYTALYRSTRCLLFGYRIQCGHRDMSLNTQIHGGHRDMSLNYQIQGGHRDISLNYQLSFNY